jgi:hypothetical protein
VLLRQYARRRRACCMHAARLAAMHAIAAAAPDRFRRDAPHNDFLWAKILLLHAENLFIDFGAES